jgi:hypothetical protein
LGGFGNPGGGRYLRRRFGDFLGGAGLSLAAAHFERVPGGFSGGDHLERAPSGFSRGDHFERVPAGFSLAAHSEGGASDFSE